jgi:2-aminoadipate transaminase
MDHSGALAARITAIQASAIREILKVVSRPGMISLAGGLPAPESFPMDILPALSEQVRKTHGPAALQYDATEGFFPLRAALSDFLKPQGINTSTEDILVGTGSQGLLDGLGKILIDPGDAVAVESPTYLGALQAFNAYGPRYVTFDADSDGPNPDSLERTLERFKPKFVYLTPTFQNPTGRTVTRERRRLVAELALRYGVLIVEDDPYGALRYRGDPIPPLKTLTPENVVYIGTLSKVFAPGLRIGFCVAPEVIRKWLVVAKQGVDLHTSTYNQALAAEYLAGGHLDAHLPRIIGLYGGRLQAMLDAMDQHMPEGVTWTRPEGGMFLWVEGPKGLPIQTVYDACLHRKVAFVPGRYFFVEEGRGMETMRLNFTGSNEATLEKAVRILGEVLRKHVG